MHSSFCFIFIWLRVTIEAINDSASEAREEKKRQSTILTYRTISYAITFQTFCTLVTKWKVYSDMTVFYLACVRRPERILITNYIYFKIYLFRVIKTTNSGSFSGYYSFDHILKANLEPIHCFRSLLMRIRPLNNGLLESRFSENPSQFVFLPKYLRK